MELGKFFFIKRKDEEKSQFILVKCVAEEQRAMGKTYYYRYFDKEKVALIGALKPFDSGIMDCEPFGATPKEWTFLEEFWERYL